MRTSLSPISRLPTELLCEIFVCCLRKTPTTAPINVSHADEAPLLLCQVCSKWRRTAVAFPPLWKALALQTSYAFDDNTNLITTLHPSVAGIMDSWFSRAGSCLLSLRLDLQPCENGSEIESELTFKLEEILIRLPVSRLQHLSLSSVWPSDTYILSKILQEFTELKSIVLQAESDSDLMPVPDRLLQLSPRLHSAELHNFIQPHSFPKSLIPWSQLTHLRVEGHLGEPMWYILVCHCTNLRRGVFSIGGTNMRAPGILHSNREIILPHLVYLTVHIDDEGDKPNFRQLVFPVLKKLQLLFTPMTMSFRNLCDGDLLATDSNSLSRLVIVGGLYVPKLQLHSFLQSLSSSITELHLSVETYYTDFFKTLTSSSTTQQLLPTLEALQCEIRYTGDRNALLRSIVSFVGSRWGGPNSTLPTTRVTRLRRLTLKFQDNNGGAELVEQVNQLLTPFRDQGLSLALDIWSGAFPNLKEMMTCEPEW